MGDDTEIFVGIDVAKVRNAIAIADGERGGEVRFLGRWILRRKHRRVVKRIAAKHRCVQFCYEAGPTGYGLHRLITSLGHSCIVVAPSLVPRRPGDQVKTNSATQFLWPSFCVPVNLPRYGYPTKVMRRCVISFAVVLRRLRLFACIDNK